jgi:hypothetical protein
MEDETASLLRKTLGRARNQRTEAFWAVVILSLPAFAAFLIVVTAMRHPNMSVYLLIPLTVVAPACLISAIGIAIAKRHHMDHQLSRIAWTVLALAFLAGIAAIGFVKLT